MSTINISLPQEQVSFIDSLVSKYGFANRSEFVRGIVRLLRQKPTLIARASVFPFEPPQERSTKKIISSMQKTGKYSSAFLRSLEKGLLRSRYFKP